MVIGLEIDTKGIEKIVLLYLEKILPLFAESELKKDYKAIKRVIEVVKA